MAENPAEAFVYRDG